MVVLGPRARIEAALDPVVDRDSGLVNDGRPSYAMFAHHRGTMHVAVAARQGVSVREGGRIQNVSAHASRLKSRMAAFKGVASKYLATDLGWGWMIERDGNRLTPAHPLAEVIGA